MPRCFRRSIRPLRVLTGQGRILNFLILTKKLQGNLEIVQASRNRVQPFRIEKLALHSQAAGANVGVGTAMLYH